MRTFTCAIIFCGTDDLVLLIKRGFSIIVDKKAIVILSGSQIFAIIDNALLGKQKPIIISLLGPVRRVSHIWSIKLFLLITFFYFNQLSVLDFISFYNYTDAVWCPRSSCLRLTISKTNTDGKTLLCITYMIYNLTDRKLIIGRVPLC